MFRPSLCFIAAAVLFAYFVAALPSQSIAENNSIRPEQPNILWIVQEDLSPWIGCYGHDVQKGMTPNIDAMAAGGVKFSRAFVPAPVCSACRSALVVGANQIRFGAHEHRSRRGKAELPLPEGIKTITHLMNEKGYFCFNIGKTDYNFEHAGIYSNIQKKDNKTPWRARPEGKPFFGQIQLKGGKLNTKKFNPKTDRSKVSIPADYPQNEMYREIVAEHYDSARMDDARIGNILEQLETDGLSDSTIVVYFSDHGANNLVRHKQQPTEGGLHVPFVIKGPKKWVSDSGVDRNDLVSILDITATSLAWAGIEKPQWVEGRDLFAKDFAPRDHVCSARDRCDNTIERIRTVRTDRFRYTRNYMVDRVLLQPQYRDPKDYVQALRDSYANGSLDKKLADIYFGERPTHELYDVQKDPAQMNNLAGDPAFADELTQHQKLLDAWIAKGDMGEGPEPDIELEMNHRPKWGIAVNPEYERVRKDSDKDGLSDDFEEATGRDPTDGQLVFTFDSGGWQTEGWTTKDDLGNLAGSQGFLEFKIPETGEGLATITRGGFEVKAKKNPWGLKVSMKSDQPVKMSYSANGNRSRTIDIDAVKELAWQRASFEDSKDWSGTINSVDIHFEGKPGTTIVIDKINTGK